MQGSARAHAVAEIPIDGLLARADELARRWAIALILARPLELIGEVPLEDLARDAPALMAQILRALQSDVELERLTGAGVPGPAEAAPAEDLQQLAGAGGAVETVQAVEALRGVLWEALRDELGWPGFDSSPPLLIADLADRLAFVCATALAAALARGPAVDFAGRMYAPAGRQPGVPEADRPRPARRPVVIVDERRDAVAPAPAPAGAPGPAGAGAGMGASAWRAAPPAGDQAAAPSTSQPPRARPRARPWDTPLRSERPERSRRDSPDTVIEVIDAQAGGPVMRVTRRSAAPSEERP
jgi:hypothetical protein